MPSKYKIVNGKWVASKQPEDVAIGSRLMANLIAHYYDLYAREYCKGYLVDLGCGRVPLYGIYRDYISNNICVDWGQSLHRNVHVDIEADLSDRLPVKNESFDTIILSDVLEHIPKPEQMWLEMNRILRPGGVVILNVPFMYGVHEEPFDYYRYTEYSLRLFAQEAGFIVKKLDPMGGGLEVIANLCAKILKYLPVLSVPFSILVQELTEVFVRTTIGKKLSAATKFRYSLGYFMVAEKMKNQS